MQLAVYSCPVNKAVAIKPIQDNYRYSELAPDFVREKNGVVYTKIWVVDLILDLVGYDASKPLAEMLLIEPAAGDGSFLLRAAARVVESCRLRGLPIIEARSAIIAYEIDEASSERARGALKSLLISSGAKRGDAEVLSDSWVRTGDFLLESGHLQSKADFVVGNPPYIRMEDMEDGGSAYRSMYRTMVGRSDIYVAFYEAALRQLKKEGVCGFICADRWMFNQYGAELRNFITSYYAVQTVIQMHHAEAFESEVSAYPAVTIIKNSNQGAVTVATLDPKAERIGASGLAQEFRLAGKGGTNAARIDNWFSGSSPWPLLEPQRLALLRRLEAEYHTIESTSVSVGIGVATGADKVFVTKNPNLVESERLLPMAMAKDTKGKSVQWSGHYLVNPWNGKGLVDLAKYPKLATYFGQHREQLLKRHVGKKAPANWYRTIDRVNAELTGTDKLYFPDFNGRISPVLDRGETYPHHNLYFMIPGHWDIEALGGLLLSDVAQFFIEAYGVRMRGGFIRFQAQYLRRICVPMAHDLTTDQIGKLKQAFEARDVDLANEAAAEVYKLTKAERELLNG